MYSPARRRALLSSLILLLTAASSFAGSATWKSDPVSGDWNNADNWSPATVPNGPSDVATFGVSNQTSVTVSTDVEVAQIVFSPGASSFTITSGADATLTLSTQGVTNNSGLEQKFDLTKNASVIFTNAASAGELTSYTTDGLLRFNDDSTAATANITTNNSQLGFGAVEFNGNATAGSATMLNRRGTVPGTSGGHAYFYENSNAGSANITNEAIQISGPFSSQTVFYDHTSAGSAIFTNEGCPIDGLNISAVTWFFGTSTADNATFILHGGTRARGEPGEVFFRDSSSGGNATFFCDNIGGGILGGGIRFEDTSVGGTCRFVFLDRGTSLNLLFQGVPLTLGSIEGFGRIVTGLESLAVGSNDLDTTFAGLIQGPGLFMKVGKGKLVLTGANTYSKATQVDSGALIINNTTGSATGTGPVVVGGGTLGGNGIISGRVTIGKGGSKGAVLAPGIDGAGLLTVGKGLTFGANGSYRWNLDTETAKADEIVATGVTISSQAFFSVNGRGNGTLPIGTTFTVIDNRAATPISGQFSNLFDGSIFLVGTNRFQASFSGGDGNDLTLTVVL